MKTKKFSLLYSGENNYKGNAFVNNFDILEQLEVDSLLKLRNVNLFEYLTENCEDIEYRQAVFNDIANIPVLSELINEAITILSTIDELRKIKTRSISNEGQLYSIKELEIYIKLMDFMSEKFRFCRNKLRSEGLIDFCNHVLEDTAREEYKKLKSGVAKMKVSINNIKSVTIGCNLNSNLSPYESGLLSINTEYIRSGELIDKFLSLDRNQDEFRTIAPLTATRKQLSKKEKDIADMIFIGALKKAFGSSLRQWEPLIRKYLLQNTVFYLNLLPELQILSAGAKILTKLKKYDLPLCKPIVCPKSEKKYTVKGLYNPVTAIKLKESDKNIKIIYNNFSFDKNGMIYILTGPNRGGKSVFTYAVGIAQLFFQLGLSVPAKYAELSPVDCIYTHFPTEAISTLRKGRLGEECTRMQKIFSVLTEYSLVLLDETLSSTDSYEGSFIASEIVAGLSAFCCRAIYCTHMHELAARASEINTGYNALSKVDTLTAGIENGNRSYIIKRMAPDGKSYARDIANKYGLSYEKILNIKNRKGDFENGQ